MAQGNLIQGATLERAIAFSRELGLDPDAFWASAPRARQGRQVGGQRVPNALFAAYLRWAAEASGDPHFGLNLGSRFHPSDFGAYGYLLMNARTLGESLELAQSYFAFQQQGGLLKAFGAGRGQAEIRYDGGDLPEATRRHDAECGLGVIAAVSSHLAGRRFQLLEVRVQHARASTPDQLAAHFRCPVTYNDRDNALVFAADALALPIPGADARLQQILRQYVAHEIEGLPADGDLTAELRWRIRRALPTGAVSLKALARSGGPSARTIQRRLDAAGLSFSRLVDAVRRERLEDLQAAGGHSQREIANLLGFSDLSAMTKARRRWAGAGGVSGPDEPRRKRRASA
jgi:AraC-like DNA-binding protein